MQCSRHYYSRAREKERLDLSSRKQAKKYAKNAMRYGYTDKYIMGIYPPLGEFLKQKKIWKTNEVKYYNGVIYIWVAGRKRVLATAYPAPSELVDGFNNALLAIKRKHREKQEKSRELSEYHKQKMMKEIYPKTSKREGVGKIAKKEKEGSSSC